MMSFLKRQPVIGVAVLGLLVGCGDSPTGPGRVYMITGMFADSVFVTEGNATLDARIVLDLVPNADGSVTGRSIIRGTLSTDGTDRRLDVVSNLSGSLREGSWSTLVSLTLHNPTGCHVAKEVFTGHYYQGQSVLTLTGGLSFDGCGIAVRFEPVNLSFSSHGGGDGGTICVPSTPWGCP